MFGKECRFVIDENETFKTGIGGFMSILVYLGLITLTWNFGQDIYQRQSPKVVQQLDFLNSTPYVEINNSNYNVAINMLGENGFITPNKSAFYYSAYIQKLSLNFDVRPPTVNTSYMSIDINHCDNTTVEQEYFRRDHFAGSFCPFIANSTIGGAIEEDLDDYKLILEIKRCNSRTQNTTKCMDDREIIKTYGAIIEISVKVQNNYFNPKSYESPLIKNFGQEVFKVQSVGNNIYESYLTYGLGTLIDDPGLIFESDTEPLLFTQLQKVDFYNLGTDMETETLIKLTTKISRTGILCSREYLKIPDVLANVGGFMGLLTPIIEYLIAFYVDSEYYIYLYKHLFKFEIEKDDGSNVNQLNNNSNINDINSKDVIKLSKMNSINKNLNANDLTKTGQPGNLGNSIKENEMSVLNKSTPGNLQEIPSTSKHDYSKLDLINNDNNPQSQYPDTVRKLSQIKQGFKLKEPIVNKDVKRLLSYKSRGRKVINITTCERFCVLGCCCFNKKQSENLKYELINHAEKELEKKFDVIEVFKLFNQLRVITKLLLNENQCFLLENREMHTLTNSKSKPLGEIEDLNVVKYNESYSKCLEYLKSKKQEAGFSVIDLILIKYLKEDLKSKFNEEIQCEL